MSVESEIRKLAAGIAQKRPYIRGEESTKDALIRPMIRALGYDTSNPAEVSSEFTADFGTRQHEKVDFAILAGGRPVILIECKTISSRLGNNEIAQLFRYFSATDASFAILTNGVRWRFFTDLQTPNRMDTEPFLDVNLEHLDGFHLAELMRFARDNFDEQAIRANAEETRVKDALLHAIDSELSSPSPEFVKFFARKVYRGQLTRRMMEYFTPLVVDELDLCLRLYFQEALDSLERGNPPGGETPGPDDPDPQPQPVDDPDFSKFRNWEQTVANPKLHPLVLELVASLRSLGKGVWIEAREKEFSVKPQRGAHFNVCYFRPRPSKTQISLKIPGQDGPMMEIRNHADLERAKPLLERSYDKSARR